LTLIGLEQWKPEWAYKLIGHKESKE
jgi:hypothetical protein